MITKQKTNRWLTVTIILFAGFVLADNALALAGTSDGIYKERLKVTQCGTGRDVSTLKFNLKKNKRWSSDSSLSGKYNGKYRQKSGGRKITLEFNSKSRRKFLKIMKKWASELCGTKVSGVSVSNLQLKGKINKKFTKMTGTVKVKAKGKTKFGSGTANYNGKVKGNFIAAP